ncbi:hypothetical protein GUITHDRAFT_144546 [Guillardia theta CCMP2712]|uniref:Uncharacterized protein n=1 Tax=Guillardia theta (strain CCMP2712) TaxID=905079 RepID=L1IQ94_GUITC|nr:hypothetical protein GUITHDRAFT_144546 [Guillardia theta CCMP2712]EKX38054.1 hypothetical protein GUITHDRAFT_144546 [Guillardia theta CCMP2712]|eukprot:XP_005825034.1 hypothetical protein GUITHDRAFT_144546 [Guillardia theta CCMP2712]
MNGSGNLGRQNPPGAKNFGNLQPPRNPLPQVTPLDVTSNLPQPEANGYPPVVPADAVPAAVFVPPVVHVVGQAPKEIQNAPRDPRSNPQAVQRSRDPRLNVSTDRSLPAPGSNSPRFDGREKSQPSKLHVRTTQQSPTSSPRFPQAYAQPSPLLASSPSMLGHVPGFPRPGEEHRTQPLPRLTHDSSFEAFLNGQKRRKVVEKTFHRLCCSPEFIELIRVLKELKAATISLHQENIMQMKYGLTRGDIDFEYETLLSLKENLAHKSMAWEYNLAKAWQIIGNTCLCCYVTAADCCDPSGKPLTSLDVANYPDEDIVSTLNVANTSEVIKGFVFLGAGGQKNEEVEKPIMVSEMSKQFRERKMILQKWYDDNRIRYILNLAKDEQGMEKMKYPFEYEEVEPETSRPDLRTMRIENDDDDDETIRVLRLPMKDTNEYDVENSWELFEAARSPLALIYWLLRFCSHRSVDQDNVIERVKHRRRTAFREYQEKNRGLETVLKDKEIWMSGVKTRIEKEIACETEALPFERHVEDYLNLKRRYACRISHGSLGIFAVDCGGLPGSPIFSDEEDQT